MSFGQYALFFIAVVIPGHLRWRVGSPDFILRRWLGGHVFGEVVSVELSSASDTVLVHLVCAGSQSFIAFVVHRHGAWFQFARTFSAVRCFLHNS